MKYTPLYQKHVAAGAKMVEFAGYMMPLIYSSIKEEHLGVRNSCGLFDVSHMGEFIIRGPEAEKLVQKITINDIKRIKVGQAQYSAMTDEYGGIIDDLIVYRLDNNNPQMTTDHPSFMLVVNASNIDKDYEWIVSRNDCDAELINISYQSALLALQGPKATEILQNLTDVNLEDIAFYHFKRGQVAGVDNVIISATGYTGSGGFELYIANEHAEKIWDALVDAGGDKISLCGLGSRDTLRLEMGYNLYGNDMNEDTTPLEASLSWITKLEGDDFIGRDAISKQKENKPRKKLVGLSVEGRRVARPGNAILDEDGNTIGIVTSGTLSPSLEKPIAMGYVDSKFQKKGNKVFIDLGRKTAVAEVCRPPFLKL